VCPRSYDECSFVIDFHESPNLPSFPISIHPNVTEYVTAQTTIVSWVGDEKKLMPGLVQTGKREY
jgi:hypothetical protein